MAGQIEHPVQRALCLQLDDDLVPVAIQVEILDGDAFTVGIKPLVEQQRRGDGTKILVEEIGIQGDAEGLVERVDQLEVQAGGAEAGQQAPDPPPVRQTVLMPTLNFTLLFWAYSGNSITSRGVSFSQAL